MLAPADNTNALKFKTPEERKTLCEAYAAHIESGLSDECFGATAYVCMRCGMGK